MGFKRSLVRIQSARLHALHMLGFWDRDFSRVSDYDHACVRCRVIVTTKKPLYALCLQTQSAGSLTVFHTPTRSLMGVVEEQRRLPSTHFRNGNTTAVRGSRVSYRERYGQGCIREWVKTLFLREISRPFDLEFASLKPRRVMELRGMKSCPAKRRQSPWQSRVRHVPPLPAGAGCPRTTRRKLARARDKFRHE